jgi:hypothetical protein
VLVAAALEMEVHYICDLFRANWTNTLTIICRRQFSNKCVFCVLVYIVVVWHAVLDRLGLNVFLHC